MQAARMIGTMRPIVESKPLAELTPSDRQAIAELIVRTWPKPEKDADFRGRQLAELADTYDGPMKHAPRAFLVREKGRVIANALIEPRNVLFAGGGLTILGLSKVCSDPARRGEGLGAVVVRACFGMVDDHIFDFALFQTSHPVRAFYERLGCCVVENRVVNNFNPEVDPVPFEDDLVMRYPAGGGWPEGEIDLNGPGY